MTTFSNSVAKKVEAQAKHRSPADDRTRSGRSQFQANCVRGDLAGLSQILHGTMTSAFSRLAEEAEKDKAWRSPAARMSKLEVGQGSGGDGKSMALRHVKASWAAVEKWRGREAVPKGEQRSPSPQTERLGSRSGGKGFCTRAATTPKPVQPETKFGRAESGSEAEARSLESASQPLKRRR
jgi:hypothetical protein